MLRQHRRRWPSIEPTLVQCLVFTDTPDLLMYSLLGLLLHHKQVTLNQCWFNVGPSSATLSQHLFNLSTLKALNYFVKNIAAKEIIINVLVSSFRFI